MVSDDEARRLFETAGLLGMDVLVEANDAAEVERAVAPGAADDRRQRPRPGDAGRRPRRPAASCSRACPEGVLRVAESGIASRADVEAARDAGADAVLVGTVADARARSCSRELVGVPR